MAPARAGGRVRSGPDSIRDRSQRPTSQDSFRGFVAAGRLGSGRSPGCPARSFEYCWPLPSPFFALAPMTKAEHRPSTAERLVADALLQRRGIELDAPGLADVGGQRALVALTPPDFRWAGARMSDGEDVIILECLATAGQLGTGGWHNEMQERLFWESIRCRGVRSSIGPAGRPDLADLYPGHGHSARVQ